jgi:hypothetical protein
MQKGPRGLPGAEPYLPPVRALQAGDHSRSHQTTPRRQAAFLGSAQLAVAHARGWGAVKSLRDVGAVTALGLTQRFSLVPGFLNIFLEIKEFKGPRALALGAERRSCKEFGPRRSHAGASCSRIFPAFIFPPRVRPGGAGQNSANRCRGPWASPADIAAKFRKLFLFVRRTRFRSWSTESLKNLREIQGGG